MAVAAAEVQHPQVLVNEEAHHAPLFLVVIGVPRRPLVALGGKTVGLLEKQALAWRKRALRLAGRYRKFARSRRYQCGFRLPGAVLHCVRSDGPQISSSIRR